MVSNVRCQSKQVIFYPRFQLSTWGEARNKAGWILLIDVTDKSSLCTPYDFSPLNTTQCNVHHTHYLPIAYSSSSAALNPALSSVSIFGGTNS